MISGNVNVEPKNHMTLVRQKISTWFLLWRLHVLN